jgi:hypothetical protein
MGVTVGEDGSDGWGGWCYSRKKAGGSYELSYWQSLYY